MPFLGAHACYNNPTVFCLGVLFTGLCARSCAAGVCCRAAWLCCWTACCCCVVCCVACLTPTQHKVVMASPSGLFIPNTFARVQHPCMLGEKHPVAVGLMGCWRGFAAVLGSLAVWLVCWGVGWMVGGLWASGVRVLACCSEPCTLTPHVKEYLQLSPGPEGRVRLWQQFLPVAVGVALSAACVVVQPALPHRCRERNGVAVSPSTATVGCGCARPCEQSVPARTAAP